MSFFKDLFGQIISYFHYYLTQHPEFRDFIEDVSRQARSFWDEVSHNTPPYLFLALVLLSSLLVSLIISRVFVDSLIVTWILRILPTPLYRKAIIKRAERFAKKGRFIEAGKLLQAIKEYERSVAMFVRGGDYGQSARIYIKMEKFREAARIYEEGKDYAEAAKYYEKDGLFHKAGDMYLQTRNFLKAAANYAKCVLALEQENDSPDKIKKIEGFAAKAGDLYLKSKDYSQAGPMLEKAHHYDQSAFAYSKANEPLCAARCLEAGDKFKEAAKIYAENGDLEKAAVCYEKGGVFFEAGDLYNKLGDTDRAISQYQKVTSQSKNYEQVTNLLGNLFQKKGMLGPAREKYQKLIERKGVTRENLETFYNLALLTEKIGDLNESISIYEKIISEDMNYKDVPSRLEQLKERAKQASQLTPEETEAHTITNRYKVINELGRGGMGIVYRAEDLVLKRIVAYKILPDTFKDNPQFLESFMQEARTSAALNHTNIVTIYDTGKVGSNYYITMEYVDGLSLKELLGKTKGVVPLNVVLGIARQLSLGLEYAHEKNVVHRDIKPANLMLTRDKIVKIMDFGLAKLLHEGASEKTSVKGTPYYMSPEQILGKNVDAQTDLYAMGCTLYHLVAGRPPFIEGDIYYHHLHTHPESPKKYNGKIPDSLVRILMKSIEKNKSFRYANPTQILNDLAEVQLEPVKI
ncbi:MAG: protein kinase [Nitrospiria bacterium]